MPLTEEGKSVLASMRKQYGDKKAKEIFYASINAKKEGSEKWHVTDEQHKIAKKMGVKLN